MVDFLSDVNAELKTVEKRQRVIEKAASGLDLPEILFTAAMSLLWSLAKTAPFIAQARFLSLRRRLRKSIESGFQCALADLLLLCAHRSIYF